MKYREGLVNRARVLSDIDIRTDGGYIIAPPSIGANGKPYTWTDGFSIAIVEPATMPENLFQALQAGAQLHGSPDPYIIDSVPYIDKKSIYIEGSDHTKPQIDHKRPQLTTTDHKSFTEGHRDQTLFHIANHLVKGDMHPKEIEQLLALIAAKICVPPFPKNEIPAKIQSALKRSHNREKSIAQDVRDWVLTTTGHFLTTDNHKDLGLTTRDHKKAANMALLRLVDEGVLEKHGERRGSFRRVDTECEEIDWINAPNEAANIKWPLGVEELALLYPKNLAMIAGSKDAGKTCLALNLAYMNREIWPVRYLSSEMGQTELKTRLKKFGHDLKSWGKIDFRERSSNFADVVLPNGLNIIDFYEISKDFWTIAADLKLIYEKLKTGVCVVCLQKSEDKEMGRGGDFGLEKPRLYLTVDADPPAGNVLKIYRAKNFAQEGVNPRGMQTHFNIIGGAKIKQLTRWA
ncbi:bifunctional DNA primase/polymerase [Thermodesulfobacteriota bacterium]